LKYINRAEPTADCCENERESLVSGGTTSFWPPASYHLLHVFFVLYIILIDKDGLVCVHKGLFDPRSLQHVRRCSNQMLLP